MTKTYFKGFDKDFKCRDLQFEVGKTYEHDGDIEICSSGFHACENPLDVWAYYGPFESRFALVELPGKKKKHDQDSKVVAAKIEIKAELSLPEFINHAVDWVIDYCKKKDNGEQIRASSGYSAQIGSSGYYAQIGSSGYSARIGSSGYYARIGSSGDYARIVAEGKDSVIASAGYNATVKGAKGTWISIAEYNDDGKCVGFATGCIGKKGLKPNTPYKAKGGKLVEK